MPKSTFYKISEEKQNRIINAGRNEFLNVPYSKVSINKIIREAGIPHGSFYQYFEDKEDLFYYLLKEQKNEVLEILLNELNKAKGNLFASIEKNIDKLVEFVYGENRETARMLFAEPKILETVWMAIMKDETCQEQMSGRLLDKIDSSILDVENEEELITLLNILGVVVRDSIGKLFLYSDRICAREARDMFCVRIRTLKKHYSK